MHSEGPYIAAALFCERVLREQDGVLSHIRVVDRVTQHARGKGAPGDMTEFVWEASYLVTMKSGKARGRHEVRLDLEKPSGESNTVLQTSVRFEGEERGVTVLSDIKLKITQEGLYWMHVYLDNEELTRSPLRVIYQRSLAGPPSDR